MENVEKDVGIPANNLKFISSNRAVCLVTKKWLSELTTKSSVPDQTCDHIPANQKDLLLAPSQTIIPEPWKKLSIKVFPKKDVLVQRQGKFIPTVKLDSGFSEIFHSVQMETLNYEWRQWFSKYGQHLVVPRKTQVETQNYNSAVQDLLSKLFHCPFIRTNGESAANDDVFKYDGHHGIMPALCVVESLGAFYVVQLFHQHSLQDITYFSPAVMSGCFAKPLFVLYQILQTFHHCHSIGLHTGNLTLADVMIDSKLWVQLNLPRVDCLSAAIRDEVGFHDNAVETNVSALESVNFNDLSKLTHDWVYHRMSNFDYLMAINRLAGRRDNDPNHHPVLPWVMDFTVRDGGYRDFSKSKFRLNKGDTLLDLMFESIQQTGSVQPQQQHFKHHITEVLSEITYFVYKARRTPKDILCSHVRPKWVPNEYPSSMQRLQEWTPDECIPEFFTDPTIFTSIHEDLPDLELPEWSSSAEDFVKHHMAVLEGSFVSQHLHEWIDLTFGYKLSGTAAVKYKNVCLQLVDGHTTLNNHGIVQLFEKRHPPRLTTEQYFSSIPPEVVRQSIHIQLDMTDNQAAHNKKFQSLNTAVQVFGDNIGQHEGEKRDSGTFLDKRPRSDTESSLHRAQKIKLPDGFNPLSALKKMEILHSFTAKSLPDSRAKELSDDDSTLDDLKSDMQVLACLVAELFLSSKLRTTGPTATLKERFHFVKDISAKHIQEFPNPIRHCMSMLLLTDDADDLRDQLNVPYLTPGYLLNPLTSIIHFPSYFADLYKFLCAIRTVDQKLSSDPWSASLIKEKVHIMQYGIQTLSDYKQDLAIHMILPYVEEMFADDRCAVHAIWTLFSSLTLNLDREQTLASCLDPLVRLFNVDRPCLKHMKYYHRSFLIQLIMRLGLQTFLTHFSTLLVEAVSGYHDYIPQSDLVTNQVSCDEDFVPQQSNSDLGITNIVTDEPDGDLPSSRYSSRQRKTSETSNGYESDSESELLKSLGKASIRTKLVTKLGSTLEEDSSIEPKERVRKLSSGSIKSWSSVEADDQKDKEDSRSRHSSGESGSSGTRSHSPSKVSTSSANSQGAVAVTTTILEDTMEEALHRNGEANICDVASESIRWLAHRLGPVLTAKYLSGNLLRMLTLCYMGQEQLTPVTAKSDVLSASNKVITGDWNASKVLICLSDIAVLYGEQIVLLQYLKHVVNLINSTKQKITVRTEAGLVSCATLIHHILPFMSDSQLMNCLTETIFKEIIEPMISRSASVRLTFPSGRQARAIIMYKVIDILYLIGLRLGFEMARNMLADIMQHMFLTFDTIYKGTDIATAVMNSPNSPPMCSIPLKTADLSRSFSEEAYLDIKLDSGTHEYTIGTPVRLDSFHLLSESAGSSKLRPHSLTPPHEDEDQTTPEGNKEQILEEIRSVFSPELANTTYVAFCKLIGNFYVDANIKNYDLIRCLCQTYEEASSASGEHSSDKTKVEDGNDATAAPRNSQKTSCLPVLATNAQSLSDESTDNEVSGSFGSNVIKIGNRIALSEDPPKRVSEAHQMDTTRLKSPEIERNNKRHLRGNWLAYWEHELGRSERETTFNFKQIKLQSFNDHTSSIRAIYVMNNENSFISASKDKTVKLWSLRNMGDGNTRNQSQWSYPHHKKSVFSVTFLESIGIAASCDSSLHLWDPFVGACLKQFESSRYIPVTVLSPLPAPSFNLVAGTTEGTLKFVDVREKDYIHEFRCSTSQAGLIRCISVSPNGLWVAVGFSSGIISVLDVRTGLVMGVWKGHDNEVLQLHAYDKSRFVTSSFDGTMTMWHADDHRQECTFKGQTDPVHCFDFYRNEIVSITTGNRVGVHTDVTSNASFSSVKLRSDTFKGVLTTMAILPLNRMLLLGADNGTIKLLC